LPPRIDAARLHPLGRERRGTGGEGDEEGGERLGEREREREKEREGGRGGE
jgi:hypothetical protein